MYYFIIAAIVALDQAVKVATVHFLAAGESIPVIENIFQLTYVRNSGAAFSILQNHRMLLIFLPVVLVASLLLFLIVKGKKEHAVLKTAVAAIIGGGIGNLIDRIIYGYVVDMFDFRVWPVFNIADIAVCTGCGLLLLYVIFFDKKRECGEKTDGGKSI